jgi:hypothetical protein
MFQTHCYSEYLGAPGIGPSTSGSAARNSHHWTTEAAECYTFAVIPNEGSCTHIALNDFPQPLSLTGTACVSANFMFSTRQWTEGLFLEGSKVSFTQRLVLLSRLFHTPEELRAAQEEILTLVS